MIPTAAHDAMGKVIGEVLARMRRNDVIVVWGVEGYESFSLSFSLSRESIYGDALFSNVQGKVECFDSILQMARR